MSSYAISGRGRLWIQTFFSTYICLVQCGSRGKCLSFCYKDCFVTFLNCRVILRSIFSALRVITYDRPGTADTWFTNRVSKCWVCCVPNCIWVHLAVQGEYVTDGDFTEQVLELDSDILLRVKVTLTMTQMISQVQTPHSGLTEQTFDLLYL